APAPSHRPTPPAGAPPPLPPPSARKGGSPRHPPDHARRSLQPVLRPQIRHPSSPRGGAAGRQLHRGQLPARPDDCRAAAQPAGALLQQPQRPDHAGAPDGGDRPVALPPGSPAAGLPDEYHRAPATVPQAATS